jgi:hypothetical protein
MSRVKSFTSMVARRKSECCNVLYIVFEKCGKDWNINGKSSIAFR